MIVYSYQAQIDMFRARNARPYIYRTEQINYSQIHRLDKPHHRFSAVGGALIDTGILQHADEGFSDLAAEDLLNVVGIKRIQTDEAIQPLCVVGSSPSRPDTSPAGMQRSRPEPQSS